MVCDAYNMGEVKVGVRVIEFERVGMVRCMGLMRIQRSSSLVEEIGNVNGN